MSDNRIRELEKLLESEPENDSVLDELDFRYLSMGRREERVGVYARQAQWWKSKDPRKAAKLFFRAGQILTQSENEKQSLALDQFEVAFELDIEYEPIFSSLENICLRLQDWNRLLEVYRKKMEASKDEEKRVEWLIKSALVCEKNLDFPLQAIQFYERAQKIDPRNTSVLKNLASLLERTEQWNKAIPVWEDTLKMTENKEARDYIHFHIGSLWEKTGEKERAVASYRSVQTDAFRHQAQEALQRIYEDEPSSLIPVMAEKVEEIKDKSEKARVYRQLGDLESKRMAALSFYQKALENDPAQIDLLGKISDILWESEQMDAWFVHQQKVIDALPTSSAKVAFLKTQADEVFKRDKNGRFLPLIHERILSLLPNDAQTIETLIQIYKNRNRSELLLKILIHKEKYCPLFEKVGLFCEIANVCRSLGLQEKAMIYHQKVLQMQENHPDSLENKKQRFIQEGNFSEVIHLIDQKIEAEPAYAVEGYLEMAEIYRERIHDVSKAIEMLKNAIHADAFCLSAYERLCPLLAEKKEWEAYFTFRKKQSMAVKDKKEAIRIHFEIADRHLAQGDPERAKEHLRQVVRFDPAHSIALEKWVSLCKSSEDWETAARMLEESTFFLESPEPLPLRYLELGEIYEVRLHRHDRAIEFYEKAHCLSPLSEEILSKLQRVYELEKREEGVIYCLTVLAKIAKNESSAHFLCRLANLFAQKKEFLKSIDSYKEALEKKPDCLEAIDALIELYRQQERQDALVAMLEKKARCIIDPQEKEKVCFQLGILAEQSGESETAIRYFEKILEISPERAENIERLKGLYEKNGKWQSLLKLLKQALEGAEAAQKMSILKKIAQVYERHVFDADNLKEVYRQLLTIQYDPGVLASFQKMCRETNDWEGLLESLRMQKEKESKNAGDIYRQMARIYTHDSPDIDKAIECYEETLKYEPGNLTVLHELRILYGLKLDPRNVVKIIDLQFFSLDDPEQKARLLFEKGMIYKDRFQKTEESLSFFRQALGLFPGHRDSLKALERFYRKEKKWKELLDILECKKRMQGEDPVEIDLERAKIYLEISDQEQAETILQETFCLSPRLEAARLLVSLYLESQEFEKLETIYKTMVEHTENIPSKIEFLLALGNLYQQSERFSLASSCYIQVMSLEPGHIQSIRSLQKIYEKEKRFAALTEAYLAELSVPGLSSQRKIALHIACADLFLQHLQQKEWAANHYNQALKFDANNLYAIRGLQNLYREQGNHQSLMSMLFTELGIEKNETRLFYLHLELADLHLGPLQNVDGAVKHLIKAHRYQPHEREITEKLKKILKEQGRWEEYTEYLEEELSILSLNHEQRRSMHLELSSLYAQKLALNDLAIVHLEKALALGETDPGQFRELERLYTEADLPGKPEKFIRLYEKEASLIAEKERLNRLYRKIGFLYQTELKAQERAAGYLEKALQLDPLDQNLADELSKLYIELEKWDQVAMLYARLSAMTEEKEQKERLLFKAGSIWEKKVNDEQKALGTYQKILTISPENIEAIKGVRRLLQQHKDWHGIIEILYREAHLCEGKERAMLYLKIARIWEFKLKDTPQAVNAYLQMLKLNFHVETAQYVLSLVQSTKDYETLHWIMHKVIHRTTDSAQKAERLLELGNLLNCQLKKTEEAIKAYKKVLKYDPQKIEALSALEEIYLQQRQWSELCKVKEAKLELLSNSIQSRKLQLELGHLYETHLYDEKKAIVHYEQALKFGPVELSLIHTLQRLYKNWGYFNKYIELCEQEILMSDSPSRKIALLHEIGEVWKNRMFDIPKAIENLEKIVEIAPDSEEVIQSLVNLYSEQLDYRNLVRMSQMLATQKAKRNVPSAEMVDLYLQTGKILYEKIGDLEKSEAAFLKALEFDPHHSQALEMLLEIYEKNGNDEKLAVTMKKKIEAEDRPEQKAKRHLCLGDLEKKSGRMGGCVEAYEKANELMPKQPKILKALYDTYREMGENEKLLQVALQRVEFSEESEKAELHFEIAILLREKDKKMAIENLEKGMAFAPDHRESLLLLGNLLLEEKELEKASQIFERLIALENNPISQSSLFMKQSDLCLDLQDNAKALQKLEKGFSLNPDDLEIVTRLARLYERLGHWQQAERFYELLVHWPNEEEHKELDSADLYFRMGAIAQKLEKKEIAISRFRKTLEEEPEHSSALRALGDIYYQDRQWEEALLIYVKINSSSDIAPEERMEIQLRLSLIKDRMGMAEGAIEGYLRVLQGAPHDAMALESLGRLYFERKEEENALHYFSLLKETTQDPAAQRRATEWQGKIHEYLQNIPQAIALYKEMIECDPKTEFFERLTHLCIQARQWEDASQYARMSYTQATSDLQRAEICKTLGDIHWEGHRDEKEAISYYEMALRFIPTHLGAIRAISSIYESQSRWEEMVDAYQKFIECFPESSKEQQVPLLLDQARVLVQLQKEREAARVYQQVIQFAPEHPEAHAALAVLWAKDPEKLNEAIEEYLYLIDKDPFSSHSYHRLFSIHWKENDYDRAYLCAQALDALEQTTDEERNFLAQISPRVHSGWLDHSALDNLIPEGARGTLYEIMGSIDPFMDKVYGTDLESGHTLAKKDKLDMEAQGELQNVVHEITRLLSIPSIGVFLESGDGIVVENAQPPNLIVGRELVSRVNVRQLYFLLGHCLFYVSRNQVMAFKLTTSRYQDYISRLVEAFAETGKQASPDDEATSKKMRNALARRIRKQLEERMDILTEIYHTDVSSFLKGLERAANRFGILVSDSLRDACHAYAILKKQDAISVKKFHENDEIREFFWFNISDQHYKLRKELGLAVKWMNKL